jgi:hypothetical protein
MPGVDKEAMTKDCATRMTKWSVAILAAIMGGGCMVTAATDDGDGGGSDGGGGGSDGGGGLGGACTSATLVAGDPTYDQAPTYEWDPAGFPALSAPPITPRDFVMVGDNLVVASRSALWMADLGAANPTFVRIAGAENEDPQPFRPRGACKDVRFHAIEGLAVAPDGRVIVSDWLANSVVELSDVTSASCTGRVLAGTSVDIADTRGNTVYEPGDVVGPGAQAKFTRPVNPAVDAAGNVYVDDDGNGSIKKIANDSDRTVSRLADLSAWGDRPNIHSMTVLDGKLYASASAGPGDLIAEIDLTNPTAPRAVIEGRVFPETPGSDATILGIDHDGTDLVINTRSAYVYRVTRAGAITRIAGSGSANGSDFIHDRTQPVPALELSLRNFDISRGGLVVKGDRVYVPSTYGNGGYVLWQLDCP